MQVTPGEHAAASGQSSTDMGKLVVRSESLKRVMKLAEKVARHPAAVLIIGETGTGKEMIARTIHNSSLRCSQPLVDVNCAAIPEHLVESELFGYEKGAFSGADLLKPGFFELADKGTLFLDEIGDLDLKVQVKLLRVLDGVPYYRLGGSKKVSVDVRVVAATNRDLEEHVRAASAAIFTIVLRSSSWKFLPCATGLKMCWGSPSRYCINIFPNPSLPRM